MKMQKIETNYAQTLKVEDVRSNPLKQCVIEDIREVKTEFGIKNVMTFKHGNDVKSVFLNAPSQNNLIDAFGDDTDKMKGRRVDISVYKGRETMNNDAIIVRKSA